MATRAELIQIASELDVDVVGLDIEEMTDALKEAVDTNFNKKYLISPKGLSETLLKFMYFECQYYLVDKDGKRHDYKGEPI